MFGMFGGIALWVPGMFISLGIFDTVLKWAGGLLMFSSVIYFIVKSTKIKGKEEHAVNYDEEIVRMDKEIEFLKKKQQVEMKKLEINKINKEIKGESSNKMPDVLGNLQGLFADGTPKKDNLEDIKKMF